MVFTHPGVLTAADISCVVIPDGCVGLATLAALEQGIAVIAVRENRNRMKNDLEELGFAAGKLSVNSLNESIFFLSHGADIEYHKRIEKAKKIEKTQWKDQKWIPACAGMTEKIAPQHRTGGYIKAILARVPRAEDPG